MLFLMLGITIFNKKTILKLKFTKRLLRLIILILASQVFVLINPILYLVIELYFAPFILIIINTLLIPLETFINKKYIKKAKKKLTSINPLVIGITGSFGKTTVKNFIYQMLSNYQVSKSRKSYNTEMGICKSISLDLKAFDEVYISELGATKPKDIEKLTNLLNPTICIITDIGKQHLDSFKTIDNILKTKLEIIKSNKIEVLIINGDNTYLNEFNYPKDLKVIRVGKDKNFDVYYENENFGFSETTFDLSSKKKYHIKTKIVGKHNIINILISFAACAYLKMDEEEIISNINNLHLPNNRLEIKNINNHKIIDNSFNSNSIGFKNNIDYLSLSTDFKIVITPGIVELKKESQQIHDELAKYLIDKVDFVYLIKNKNTYYMEKEFKRQNFTNFKMVDSFKEAYILSINRKEPSTILIENDLTDYYLNGGI